MATTQDVTITELQRANVELRQERDAALAREAALAEVLSVINRSPGDPRPVFKAILEKAHRLCGADAGALMRYDGEHFHAVATHGLPGEFETLVRRPFRGPSHQKLIDGERIVHVADARVIPWDELGEVERAFVGRTNLRTSLFVSLSKDGNLLGFISADRHEVRPFSDKEIALLESFADQAVIAISNTRLITEQREALEQQTATAEVLQVINASPGNLTPVFEAMLEKAMRLCEAAIGILFIAEGDVVRVAQSRNVPRDFKDYLEREPPRLDAGSLLSRAMREQTVLSVADLRETAPFRERVSLSVAAVKLGGIRSICWVPLVHQTKALGLFAIFRREVRPFSEKQVTLLENFAAQAVIAMENARLLTEQREALEQQTATAEILQVINTNPGNLTPVFDTVIAKAMRLCGAAFGALYIYDGERFITVSTLGVPSAFAEYRAQNHPPGRRPSSRGARILKTKQSLHILDVMADESYLYGDASDRAPVDLGGARTLLLVPLLKDATVLGIIVIYRQEVRAFSAKQIALLESFAAQAVIAMENARLLTEQREALEQQTATAEVLQVINASPGNLAPVFDAMLEKALDLCGAAFGVLWTFDGEQICAVAHRGVGPEFAEFLTRTPHPVGPDNAHGRLLAGESVVHIVDVRGDTAYQSGDPLRRTLVELGGGRTLLAVPLRKDETFLGDFVIYRLEVRTFSDKQIALLKNFAAQAVIAMENARLLDEIRRRQEELRVTFENMGDGVAMFDETPRLVAWNRKFQEIFDVPSGLLEEHRTYADYIRHLAERGDYGPGADAEEQIRRITEVATQHRTYERIRPDGRVIEIRHNPVPSGGFVLIYADITERKRNEAEIHAARDAAEEASRTIEAAFRDLKAAQANLIQAEKMASLGQLTAGIAHEIKNPLNFVNNFAALSVDLLSELKETAAPGFAALTDHQRAEIDDVSAMLTSNLEKITEHGKRADGIVKAMLEHSRGSSAERRMVDLNVLIEEALNLAYHGARAQDQSFNITLERDFADGTAPIEVNPQDMTRVFLNIFSNGFYAATRRARNGGDAGFVPTLSVTTRDAGEAMVIRVRDNGVGVPAEIRDKLFEPFFSTKPTGEGTGLGLSITYDIVTKQHGGTITVDSEVDAFTEFVVTLPRKMFADGGSRA